MNLILVTGSQVCFILLPRWSFYSFIPSFCFALLVSKFFFFYYCVYVTTGSLYRMASLDRTSGLIFAVVASVKALNCYCLLRNLP